MRPGHRVQLEWLGASFSTPPYILPLRNERSAAEEEPEVARLNEQKTRGRGVRRRRRHGWKCRGHMWVVTSLPQRLICLFFLLLLLLFVCFCHCTSPGVNFRTAVMRGCSGGEAVKRREDMDVWSSDELWIMSSPSGGAGKETVRKWRRQRQLLSPSASFHTSKPADRFWNHLRGDEDVLLIVTHTSWWLMQKKPKPTGLTISWLLNVFHLKIECCDFFPTPAL